MRKQPPNESVQREIFNKIEHDPSTEYLYKNSYRVFVQDKLIYRMNDNKDKDNYFFSVVGRGITESRMTGIVRSYIDVTLLDGYREYMAMLKL